MLSPLYAINDVQSNWNSIEHSLVKAADLAAPLVVLLHPELGLVQSRPVSGECSIGEKIF